jgi:NAD(P)-dependent dehydrogenase (short-subunit alcohol dehydrogenase family)
MDLFSDLRGKTAIVTGGNQGIGFALSDGLAKYGATVVIVNRRAEEGGKAAQRIRDAGGSAISIPADVSQKDAVVKMVEKVIDQQGQIDVLVNNAGVNIRKPATEISEEDLNAILDINLKGLFFCCQAAAAPMIEQGRGKIINVSSIAYTCAFLDRTPYSATKAGVSQLTRTLALEWAKFGLTVNAIGPGIVQTPLTEAYMKSDPQRTDRVREMIPLGRFSRPEDLVGVTLFLASKASDYLTGQTIIVDGGFTLGNMDW